MIGYTESWTRYTIYQNGQFLGFSTSTSGPDAIAKYLRLHPGISAKGLTAARPVN
jgi:hypothetical protein